VHQHILSDAGTTNEYDFVFEDDGAAKASGQNVITAGHDQDSGDSSDPKRTGGNLQIAFNYTHVFHDKPRRLCV
jgi:hypothetical protein